MNDERPLPTGLYDPDEPDVPKSSRSRHRPDLEFTFPGIGVYPAEDPDPTFDRICEGCGDDFQSVSSHAQFCSPCRLKSQRQAQAVWRAENRARVVEYSRRRYGMKQSGSLTQKEWQRILATTGKCCFYCGGVFEHMDHVIPLSKGGTHDLTNVVPACQKCNLTKSAKFIHEWKSPQEALAIYDRLNQLHASLALVWNGAESL